MAIDKDVPALAERFFDGAKEDYEFVAHAISDPVVLSLMEIAAALGSEERDQLLFFAEDLQVEAMRCKNGNG
ncbi:MAG: hypothetical protein AAFQ60_00315 [Pseudomonadota bacterium]